MVAVGPGDREPSRLEDLLAGFARFESGALHQLIIVDDTRGVHDFKAIAKSQASVPVQILVAPRNGQGDSWRGGLCTNILFGIKHAFADGKANFVVKLDTDSLILSPFSKRVAALFDARPKLGMVGSLYKLDLHGKQIQPSTWKPNLRKWESLFRFRRNPLPHVETALFRRNRLIRRYLKMALANGWDAGTCAVGGGYTIGKGLFDQWSARQMLGDDRLWLKTDLGEDVVVSLLCHAVGFTAGDDNGPGGVFGVQIEGLGFSPAEMVARGYGIVHSVKCKSWVDEMTLRNEFRDLLNQVVV